MELNDNECSSDWLREMMAKTASTTSTTSTAKTAKSVFKIHPINNFKCCQNPIRMTTNDGNKTQKCTNCNWSVIYE